MPLIAHITYPESICVNKEIYIKKISQSSRTVSYWHKDGYQKTGRIPHSVRHFTFPEEQNVSEKYSFHFHLLGIRFDAEFCVRTKKVQISGDIRHKVAAFFAEAPHMKLYAIQAYAQIVTWRELST